MNGYFRGFMPNETKSNSNDIPKVKEPPVINGQRGVTMPAAPSVVPRNTKAESESVRITVDNLNNKNVSDFNNNLANEIRNIPETDNFLNPAESEEKSLTETTEDDTGASYSGEGSLVVQVFMARRALPLEGVKITVKSLEGAPVSVNEIRFTDREGKIEPIFLPAPDMHLSVQSQGTVQPYAVYAVIPELNGYHIDEDQKNALVFDRVQSIQNIEMIPNQEQGV